MIARAWWAPPEDVAAFSDDGLKSRKYWKIFANSAAGSGLNARFRECKTTKIGHGGADPEWRPRPKASPWLFESMNRSPLDCDRDTSRVESEDVN